MYKSHARVFLDNSYTLGTVIGLSRVRVLTCIASNVSVRHVTKYWTNSTGTNEEFSWWFCVYVHVACMIRCKNNLTKNKTKQKTARSWYFIIMQLMLYMCRYAQFVHCAYLVRLSVLHTRGNIGDRRPLLHSVYCCPWKVWKFKFTSLLA